MEEYLKALKIELEKQEFICDVIIHVSFWLEVRTYTYLTDEKVEIVSNILKGSWCKYNSSEEYSYVDGVYLCNFGSKNLQADMRNYYLNKLLK